MARKPPFKYVSLEERPEFLALVAELADVSPEEFPALARQRAEQYHDAVLAGHVDVLDEMEAAYRALVYKLNGNTMMGCAADDGSAANALARHVSAQPGRIPQWGQCGQFLLEVEGMRMRVVFNSNMLGNHHGCDLHAVDIDRPFLSRTGYRSAGVTASSSLGDTVDQAVRRMVMDLLGNEGKPTTIVRDHWSEADAAKRPGWLLDALAGVAPDGQLNMFGDAPSNAAAKAPMSNAERQRALRKRRKDQQLKPVMLTEAERQLLDRLREQGTVETTTGVRIVRDDGSVQASEFDAVRVDVENELRRLASINKQPTYDGLVNSLLGLRDRSLLTWAQRNEQLIAATPPEQAYPEDPKMRNLLGKALNDKDDLNQRYQSLLEVTLELYQVVDLGQHRLRASSPASFLRNYKRDSENWRGYTGREGQERAAEFTKQFAAKTVPTRNDWRQCAEKAEVAERKAMAEVIRLREQLRELERVAAGSAAGTAEIGRLMGEVQRLESEQIGFCAEVYALKKENQLLEAERNKAHGAIKTWEDRLRAAGLSTDYRKQQGE